MNPVWVVGALVSLVGHGALAWWLHGREVPARDRVVRVIRFQAWRPPPVVEPPVPKPPEPPPPALEPPRQVKRARRPRPRPGAPEPPPVATQTDVVDPAESALPPEQAAANGGLAIDIGAGVLGRLQKGDRTRSRPSPVPPRRRRYVPIMNVTRMPRAIRQVRPVVPDAWKRTGREAVVVIEVAISDRGRVLEARVVASAGSGLDQAAVDAARRTRFAPALVGDRPVSVRMQIPYRFKVRG